MTVSLIPQLDESPDTIFHAVGVALTQWELLEEQFAYLYSIFKGTPYRLDAIEEFGKSNRITRDRIAALRSAADHFLKFKFEQAWEFKIRDDILIPAEELATRRHQIAHGRVAAIATPSNKDPKPGEWFALNDSQVFGLMNPRYAHARLYQAGDPFMFGSAEILAFAERFAKLRIVTAEFATEISPPPQP